MLSPYRVLDLTDERGLLGGQILADLGADVIHIEPPGGSPARRLAPFIESAHGNDSLHWIAYTRNQRSVILDLDTPAGQARLRDLVRSAHFLIESADPGVPAQRGLSYEHLAAINPALIYVSVTPFGQSGPQAQWAASDLTILAAGGPLLLNGDGDRAPLRLGVAQAYPHAGAEAALAALIAHHERLRSGYGQHIDVSAQATVTVATQSALLATLNSSIGSERASGGLRVGPFSIRFIYPASDGYVSITHLFGPSFGPATRRLMQCLHEEGFCDAAMRDKDWIDYTMALLTGQESMEEFESVKSAVAAFTSSHTLAELQSLAVARNLLIAPVSSMADVLAEEQFRARQYWRETKHRETGKALTYPGPFARFSDSPIQYRRGAPSAGEHNDEILGEETHASVARVVPQTNVDATAKLPLAGVKILDLMWAIAGPLATRALADYGATVVRVESPRHTDACRTLTPFQNGDINSSVAFYNYNAGKRMLSLDLSQPAGREVFLDLVRWADVVCESFTPHVMRGWGLDYESLRRIKPDLIMLSTCLMGQSGPLADFAGFGNLAAAITGFYSVAGWPDRPPVGPFGAYTDYVAWRYSAISILAAIEHRRRSGRGQHIDLAQAEASLHFLTSAILDCSANGRVQQRDGNCDPQMAPHGVYPAAGDDCWVAIAITDEQKWRDLSDAMGRSDLAAHPCYSTLAARLANQDELEREIAAWTASRSAGEIEAALQARGIAASVVQDSAGLGTNAQLRHRGHFVSLAHPEHGTTTLEGSRFILSRTPARVEGTVPTLGGDNQRVLNEILGYSDERVTELVVAGALG